VRIDAFVICRETTENADGSIDLHGVGADIFGFRSFPATFDVRVLVRAVGAHDSGEHHIIIQVRDADGNQQSESMGPVKMGPRPPYVPDGWEVRVISMTTLKVTANRPGAYLINVSIDGVNPESHPIFVCGD